MESLQVTLPPDSLPILVDDLKQHLRITHSDDDAYIMELANVAYNWIEDEADITIEETDYRLVLDSMPEFLVLPKPPLISLDAIKYYDADNALQTLATSEYYVVPSFKLPGQVTIKGTVSTYARPDAVQVEFSAGFEEMPYQIPHIMRLLVGSMYEHREAEVTVNTKPLALGVDRLIAQLMNHRYV